ncbi:MAG: 4-hydroxy-tetrahydrodipicolinate synthase [Pseudomonadota bacterium]
MFQGVMTAIVTPFKEGNFDETSFSALIDWQIKNGVDALVVCGTTGEAATLSLAEHERVIQVAVDVAAGRVPVIAGAGSNCTTKAIQLAKQAKKNRADAQLQVTPFYNKPMQEGLYQHFKAIAAMVDLPIILYNVPGRTAVNMLPETVARLAQIDNIVGIKEASGNLGQIRRIITDTPEDFGLYSGEDAQNYDIYAAGGDGCISVTSNVAPYIVSQIWDKFEAGNKDEAKKMQADLEILNKTMFMETNPIPAKTALALMGKCKEEFRLPLTPISSAHKEELKSVLTQYNLL